MKINHRHYILIIFAFAAITASVLGYVFLYNKTIAQAESYWNTLAEVERETIKKAREQELVKIYETTVEDRAKLSSYIVGEDRLVGFIERVEKVGEDSKTELELSSIESLEGEVKAKIEVKGSWSGIMSALMLIENLPFSILINNVHINAPSDLSSDEGGVGAAKIWTLRMDIEALTAK